jgi:hypothetical protein
VSVEQRSFEAAIIAGRGGGALVEIPFSVHEVYGSAGQVRVRATVDGHEYRGSLAPMGQGVHALGLRKDVRAAIRKDVGDLVLVTVRPDREPRVVEVPDELRGALRSADITGPFEALSYSHRREFADWVAEAKKPETRECRAAKAVQMIRDGDTR